MILHSTNPVLFYVFQLAFSADMLLPNSNEYQFDKKEISYNAPNLSACAEWNPNGTVFTGKPSRSIGAWALFIDQSNTVFATYSANHSVYKWRNDNSSSSIETVFEFSYQPYGLFVSKTGDIYVSDNENGRINKWTAKNNTIENNAYFGRPCNHIFIALDDMLYCSMSLHHQIVKKSLLYLSAVTVVAGTGFLGSESNMLDTPFGIFVTTNFDLYVADTENNRIQLFRAGEINGQTIAGTSKTLKIYYPTSVVLDMNDNIYIVDCLNNRIVAKTSNGFRCIVSCTGTDSLINVRVVSRSMAFDNDGNIYVTDRENERIQKFLLSKNTCFENNITTNNTSTSTTSTTTDVPTTVKSDYSSSLTTNSSTYFSDCSGSKYYYDNAQISVSKQGKYDLIINSTIEVHIKLYKNYFDPIDPNTNLLSNYYGGENNIGPIQFSIYLRFDETYELIISTMYLNTTSSYSMTVIGPSYVDFNQTSKLKRLQTIYSSALTVNSSKCNHRYCTLLNFYCEIIEIHTIELGQYIIISNSTLDLYGYVYDNSNFTLVDLSVNAIAANDNSACNKQFKISIEQRLNVPLILIVTTKQQNEHDLFSLIVNGPNNVIMRRLDNIPQIIESNYTSQFTNNSRKHAHENCRQLNYYYEALKINVRTSGYYTVSSISHFDSYGYLYRHYFKPFNSEHNLQLKMDYSCEGKQFQMTTYLHSSMVYVLIMTSSFNDKNAQGTFSIVVEGPDKIDVELDEIPALIQSECPLYLAENSSRYGRDNCRINEFYYESIQINVIQSDNYSLSTIGDVDTYGYLYEYHFNPNNQAERLITENYGSCSSNQFKITTYLQSNVTYILVITTFDRMEISKSSVLVSGSNNFTLTHNRHQLTYTSELTKETQIYPRICGKGNYHYETIEIHVEQNGSYIFNSNSSILLYGYIYENNFDPSYPNENLITQSNFSCSNHFQLGNHLLTNRIYILLITTFDPNVRGAFTLHVTGPNNITLNRIVKKQSNCVVGDQCNLYTKSIGLTINDILRNHIQPNASFRKQSVLIQSAAALTMIMFVTGLINGIFSLITFQNKELRQIGCGMYLFASSITTILTITMFTVKFWFVVVTQLYATINLSILRTDCVFIGPVSKLCLYLDGWFNACIAIERTVNVAKGVHFNKQMSKRIARLIITILPIIVMCTIVHEPIHHDLFQYTTQKYKLINNNLTMNRTQENHADQSKRSVKESFEYEIEHHVLCIIRYSRTLQTYNTITLFCHLIIPFLANLFSALFIIFGTARRRSTAQSNQTFKEHILKQLSEHRQLLISPIILLLLAMPRLLLSLISGCVDPSSNPWLYFFGYFISYIPPMLVFSVFVLPSELYRKTFKDSIKSWRQQNYRRHR